jgi:flagellar secretion chaperone FliS
LTNPRSAYREVSAQGGSPVRLVVMLYEQLIEDLRLAIDAVKRSDIETRTHKINHAILILAHLQSALNAQVDGSVTQNLENFYNQVRNHLMAAQAHGSVRLLAQQVTDLLTLREAWIEVERRELAATAVGLGLDQQNLTAAPPTTRLGKLKG